MLHMQNAQPTTSGNSREGVVILEVVRFSLTGSLQKNVRQKCKSKRSTTTKVTFSEKKGSTKNNMFLNNPKKLRLKPTNNFRFRKTTPLGAFMNCSFYEDFEYLIKQKKCFLLLGENFKY